MSRLIIITATDDNYVSGALGLIYSCWLHNEVPAFYVLDNGISEENLVQFDRLASRIKCPIHMIDVSQSVISAVKLPDDRLTVSAYARLLIPELFKNEERVLYMDCDMLVTGSLRELYDTDFNGKVAAVVHDYGPGERELKMLRVPASKYFNSGLILFNIPAWREAGITEKCFKLASETVYLYHDQSVLNLACRDRITYVAEKFNIFVNVPPERRREINLTDVRVLHFVGRAKPWMPEAEEPGTASSVYGRLWREYNSDILDLLAMSDVRRSTKKLTLGQKLGLRISLLNRRRKAWMGRMVGKEKYVKRELAKKFESTFLPGIYTQHIHLMEAVKSNRRGSVTPAEAESR